MTMIVIHHLNNSRSQRVLWLLEELGLAYEIRHYQRDPATMLAPPELKTIHPLGKSPVLEEDGLVIAETGAIFQYVLEKHAGGRLVNAQDASLRLRMSFWLHYAEGSAMPPLLLKLVMNRMPLGAPWFIRGVARLLTGAASERFVDPQLRLHFDFWESELARDGWFSGPEFGAADIMMSFPVEAGANRGHALEARPNLARFLTAIHSRPAYQAALERGGPYAYA